MVSTHLKHISQIGSFPQNRDENNKSLSCHHVAIFGTQPGRNPWASLILERTPFTSANGTGIIRKQPQLSERGEMTSQENLKLEKAPQFSHPFGLLPNPRDNILRYISWKFFGGSFTGSFTTSFTKRQSLEKTFRENYWKNDRSNQGVSRDSTLTHLHP